MLMQYKRNRSPACYDSDNFPAAGEFEGIHHPVGPFAGCGECPYAGHGFICYRTEGDCMKIDMQRLHNKRKTTSVNHEMEAKTL